MLPVRLNPSSSLPSRLTGFRELNLVLVVGILFEQK